MFTYMVKGDGLFCNTKLNRLGLKDFIQMELTNRQISQDGTKSRVNNAIFLNE